MTSSHDILSPFISHRNSPAANGNALSRRVFTDIIGPSFMEQWRRVISDTVAELVDAGNRCYVRYEETRSARRLARTPKAVLPTLSKGAGSSPAGVILFSALAAWLDDTQMQPVFWTGQQVEDSRTTDTGSNPKSCTCFGKQSKRIVGAGPVQCDFSTVPHSTVGLVFT